MKFYAKVERKSSLLLGVGLLVAAIICPLAILKVIFLFSSILGFVAAVFTLKPRMILSNEVILIKYNFSKRAIPLKSLVNVGVEGKSVVVFTYDGKFPKMLAHAGGFNAPDLEEILARLSPTQK